MAEEPRFRTFALRIVASIFFVMFLFALFANVRAALYKTDDALILTVKLLLNPDKALLLPSLIWANSIRIGIGLLTILAPLLVAKFFWNRSISTSDSNKTFVWWRLQGGLLLLYSGYALIYLCLHGWLQAGSLQHYLTLLGLLALAFVSVLCIKMNIWAYMAITIGSLNPWLWIVNAIYLKNRWHSRSIKGLDLARTRNST